MQTMRPGVVSLSATVPIDLEAIKRGTAVRETSIGTYQGPAVLRATEQQRTEQTCREQMYGATFRFKPDKPETLKDWLEV